MSAGPKILSTEKQPGGEPQGPPPQIALFQIMNGMWVSQVASAVAQLGVADQIAGGNTGSEGIAAAVGADPDALYRLLRAGAAIGLLSESASKRFALTPVGATLVSDVPGSMRDILIAETLPGHWLPWGQLTEAVRRGKPMAGEVLGMEPWTYYAANPDEARWFARGMGNLSAMAAAEVTAVYDPSYARRIVDVGGSEGVLLRGFLRRAPNAIGVLFDRPEIIEFARASSEPGELADRIELIPGDFFQEVPSGGDLYLLKSILHDWPDEQCQQIVRALHRAAVPGSRLLVVEMLLPEDVTPSPVALMDMNMLVMLGGRERTAGELGALLGRCGYEVRRVIPTRGMFCLLEATRL
ncbi:MAG: O-methyltransferase family protein [Acidobacteria bacterium]|nr:O-methyltransferase family protein [Acidobacteriota bacterium]